MVADTTDAIRDHGEHIWRAAMEIARRVKRAVRICLAVAVPLALAAVVFIICGADRSLVFEVAVGVTTLGMWVAYLWYVGLILRMEVGETTLRHLRHSAAADAQTLIVAARRGLRKVLAINLLPLGAALWGLAADPKDQWLAGAILLMALILTGFAFVGPQGAGRWFLIVLAIATVVAATLISLFGNEDSYLRDAQERQAAAVALEREQRAVATTTTATSWRDWRFEESYLLKPGQRVHVNVRGDATAAGVPESAEIDAGVAPRCRPYGLLQEFVESDNEFILTSEGGQVDTGDEVTDFWLTNTLTTSCTVRVHAKLG